MADHKTDIDELSGTTTTGHEWDGLKELNTPLPKWWVYLFYATIVWGIGYCIAYPAWPTMTSYTKGVLGYSSRADGVAAYQAGQAMRAEAGQPLQQASLAEIKGDPSMLAFAEANGKAAFGDNCAPCHGTNGVGNPGYPNLQDDDWLWGGTLDDIHLTLQYGIRSDHDEGRIGDMAAFLRDELLEADQVAQVVDYVRSLSGLEPEGDADLAAGKLVFEENCVSCHGEDAKGMAETGAPNLTDQIWLFGSSHEDVTETVSNGRAGVMPAWVDRLDPITVKSLAVYVHNLGGGQ